MPIRRLFWDIETSPNVVLSWRVGYKINLDHDNILHERAVICICYKLEGDRNVHSLQWDAKQNDRAMLAKFLEVANSADELIAHNGDKFDLPWFKTRCLFHGLRTFPAYKTVDTLKWARRKFYFNSNKMDYIARFLGLGGKLKTEFGLWKKIVLQKDANALRYMVKYCRRDVEQLEKVWHKLQAHMPQASHAGVVAGLGKWTCPRCASVKVKTKLTRVSASGAIAHQMQCRECGAHFSLGAAAYSQYAAAKRESKN